MKMLCCTLLPRIRLPLPLLLAAVLLLAALPARGQTPLHEQDREWVNIAPDSLKDKNFDTVQDFDVVQIGYSDGQRVIYADALYIDQETDKYAGGFLRSDDDGKSWKVILPYVKGVGLWDKDARLIYAFTDERLQKSMDGGETWRDLTPQVEKADLAREDDNVTGLELTRVVVSPFDSSKVFLISAGSSAYALASSDGGRSWHGRRWRSAGHHGTDASMVVSQTDSSRAYVWIYSSGTSLTYSFFVRTDDWGRSFEAVSGTRAPNLHVDDKVNLYAGPFGGRFQARVSRDGGRSWQQTGREAVAVANEGALAIGRRVYGDSLYYVSYDRARSWEQLPDTAPFDVNAYGNAHVLDERDSTLFVASRNGLWAYAQPGHIGTPVDKLRAQPITITLESYPNPFRERATLEYEVPRSSRVSLAVYDMLGRRVRTLVDERRAAGQHRTRFTASDLPAGVYVARLTVGSRSTTHRLTLIR